MTAEHEHRHCRDAEALGGSPTDPAGVVGHTAHELAIRRTLIGRVPPLAIGRQGVRRVATSALRVRWILILCTTEERQQADRKNISLPSHQDSPSICEVQSHIV